MGRVIECDGSSFHSETNFRLNGKTVTVDKTRKTRLKCGEKPTLLCRTGTKPLTGTAVEKTKLNFSSNNSRSNAINYAHKLLGAQLVTSSRKQKSTLWLHTNQASPINWDPGIEKAPG